MTVIATDSSPGTLGGPSIGDVYGSTSNQLISRVAPALLPPIFTIALLAGGTSMPAHVEPVRSSQSATYGALPSRVERVTDTSREQSIGDQDEAPLPDLAKSVRSLRQRSGLTWDELARIFGVTRRTLYNWSVGGQVSAVNARAIAEVVRLVHEVDSGDPKTTRSRLLAPMQNGATLYAKLIQPKQSIPNPSVPAYSPDQLLAARHNTPDHTGKVIDFEPLD
jgi:DNA-binding transcriptional regulator YiaG